MNEELTRPQLMAVLRRAEKTGDHVAWNAAVECLSRRFWIRTDDYVLRTANGPMDPALSASILRRQRRRQLRLQAGPGTT